VRRRCLALTLVLPAVAACGSSRTPPPNVVKPALPLGTRSVDYPQSGISFAAPVNWTVSKQGAPMVATVTSGAAIVAVWRYPRTAPAPASSPALEQTRAAPIREVQSGDPSLRLGQERRVRSIHMFGSRAEYVVYEYASASLFPMVDQVVFSPLRRSLTLVPVSGA
jgi:hypothetical protein